MCQLADALRFGHVGACLPTIWYVPVHILPCNRGKFDPSERSHRGCLAKPWIKSFNCILAPVCVRRHPSVRWHRGAQKNTRNIKKKRSHPVPSHAWLRYICKTRKCSSSRTQNQKTGFPHRYSAFLLREIGEINLDGWKEMPWQIALIDMLTLDRLLTCLATNVVRRCSTIVRFFIRRLQSWIYVL